MASLVQNELNTLYLADDGINSLRLSDTVDRDIIGSSIVKHQTISRANTGLILVSSLEKVKWNPNRNTKNLFQANTFEGIVCSRPPRQCLNLFCSLVTPYGDIDVGLLPDGTKPFSEPVLKH